MTSFPANPNWLSTLIAYKERNNRQKKPRVRVFVCGMEVGVLFGEVQFQ